MTDPSGFPLGRRSPENSNKENPSLPSTHPPPSNKDISGSRALSPPATPERRGGGGDPSCVSPGLTHLFASPSFSSGRPGTWAHVCFSALSSPLSPSPSLPRVSADSPRRVRAGFAWAGRGRRGSPRVSRGTGTHRFRFPGHSWFQGLGRASCLEVRAGEAASPRGEGGRRGRPGELCASSFYKATFPFLLALSFANQQKQQTFQQMFCSHFSGEREAIHGLYEKLLLSFSFLV